MVSVNLDTVMSLRSMPRPFTASDDTPPRMDKDGQRMAKSESSRDSGAPKRVP
jgi:hypothetical protein